MDGCRAPMYLSLLPPPPLGGPFSAWQSEQHRWETPPTLHTASLEYPVRRRLAKHEVENDTYTPQN